MMIENKNNANCKICGKGYYLCMACKNNRLTPWKVHTDTAEHYKIFTVLRGFNNGVYSKDEAKEKLNNVNLSDLDNMLDSVKIQIKNIMSDKKIDEEKIDNVDNVNIKNIEENRTYDIKNEETVVTKKNVSRKRKSKTVETE